MRPIRAIRTLWKSDKRYRVAYGGRGSGKSYGVAQYVVAWALKHPGGRILCAKETQNTLSDSALAIIKRVIHEYELDGWFRYTKHGIVTTTTPSCEFIFRGLQHPDRIKSLEGIGLAWVEEATKVSNEAWYILAPTIRADDSEIWVTFNPDQEEDPTYQMFVADRRPDAEVVEVNYWQNPYFPQASYLEMAWDKANDYEKYRHVWEGALRTMSDAQVFRGKYKVDTFETPKDVEAFYYGADWGFSQDPTVLVRCYIRDDRLWIDHEVYGVGVEIADTPEMFDRVPESRRWQITADSARPETISHMRHAGFKMRGAVKGKGSVEDGISFLRSFVEIVVHERCKHTADEFKLYSYKVDRLTGEPTPNIEDKHNHIIDALRYAVESVMLSKRRPVVDIKQRIW